VIFGIGTDIIETEQFGSAAARGRQYLQTLFTPKEIEYCESKARAAQHYAVRYAAKQATLKALSAVSIRGPALCDIEIVDDERGMPEVFVYGRVKALFEEHHISRASVALSHCKDNAVAVVILEK